MKKHIHQISGIWECIFRYSLGDVLELWWNTRLNCEKLVKPQAVAMLDTLMSVVTNKNCALSIRVF